MVLGLVVYEKAPVHRPEPTEDRPAKEELQHPDQDSGGGVGLEARQQRAKARQKDVENEAADACGPRHRWDLRDELIRQMSTRARAQLRADVTVADSDGNTPLCAASVIEHTAIVTELVRKPEQMPNKTVPVATRRAPATLGPRRIPERYELMSPGSPARALSSSAPPAPPSLPRPPAGGSPERIAPCAS